MSRRDPSTLHFLFSTLNLRYCLVLVLDSLCRFFFFFFCKLAKHKNPLLVKLTDLHCTFIFKSELVPFLTFLNWQLFIFIFKVQSFCEG